MHQLIITKPKIGQCTILMEHLWIAAKCFGYSKVTIIRLYTRSIKRKLLHMQIVDEMSALQAYYKYRYMCLLLVEKPFKI